MDAYGGPDHKASFFFSFEGDLKASKVVGNGRIDVYGPMHKNRKQLAVFLHGTCRGVFMCLFFFLRIIRSLLLKTCSEFHRIQSEECSLEALQAKTYLTLNTLPL